MTGRVSTPQLDAALEHAVALGERSLQVAAYHGDELVVNAWIGEIGEDAVFPVFSVSKAITALAVHVQCERGLVDLDAPMARYWPEFGIRGKQAITMRQVLSHRAGVPQMPTEVTPEMLGDWEWVTSRLAEQEPLFEPGTTNAYHSMSFGWLLGEVVRRTDPRGRSFSRFVEEELCAPLDVDSFWFGIPAQVEPRVVPLSFPDPPSPPPPTASLAVPPAVALGPEVFNRADVHAACIPAVGAIADARSLARLVAPLATGGEPLLSAHRVRGLLEPRPDFELDDQTYGFRIPVGIGGLWIEAPGVLPAGDHRLVLGHPGVGGAIAWAELDTGLSAAICHDRMFAAVTEHPFAAVGEAIHAALEAGAPRS